jgi:hypothetical protein
MYDGMEAEGRARQEHIAELAYNFFELILLNNSSIKTRLTFINYPTDTVGYYTSIFLGNYLTEKG